MPRSTVTSGTRWALLCSASNSLWPFEMNSAGFSKDSFNIFLTMYSFPSTFLTRHSKGWSQALEQCLHCVPTKPTEASFGHWGNVGLDGIPRSNQHDQCMDPVTEDSATLASYLVGSDNHGPATT